MHLTDQAAVSAIEDMAMNIHIAGRSSNTTTTKSFTVLRDALFTHPTTAEKLVLLADVASDKTAANAAAPLNLLNGRSFLRLGQSCRRGQQWLVYPLQRQDF